MTRRKLERDRHLRLAWYAVLSFVLTMFGYLFLGFDRVHALAYSISAFALLILLNYRLVLAKVETRPRPKQHQS